jgi:type I restriction enzyme S subunit
MARTRLYPPSVDPGFPKLLPTPEGWTRTTFGEVLEVVERPTKLTPDATYRLLTAKRSRGGITLRGELSGREILTKTQFEAKAGDFLISRRQIIHGACGVVPAELDGAVVSNEYSTLRTRPTLSMEFLSHYTHAPYFQRTCFHSSHGVDVEKMIFKIDEWLARTIDLPPVSEQRKIAAILSSVNHAIETTQVVIDQLQVVKKAIMAELLTRGLPGQHTRFKQTEIGQVPEGWDVLPLGVLATVGNGSTPSKARPDYWVGGLVPWLPTGKVNDRVIVQAEEFVTQKALDECPIRLLPKGTLLVAMIGQGKTRGKVAYLEIEATINQNFAYVRPGDRLSSWFLFAYLDHTYETLRAGGRGSNQDALNCGLLKLYPVPVPLPDEQAHIANTMLGLDARLTSEMTVSGALADVKSALMSVLLTGEIRVRPDEEAA